MLYLNLLTLSGDTGQDEVVLFLVELHALDVVKQSQEMSLAERRTTSDVAGSLIDLFMTFLTIVG